MPQIATSADGDFIFLAEEYAGFPVIVKITRDLTTQSAAYDPGAGTAANVLAFPSEPDGMLFYGNFGTDVTVIKHTISTGTNTDISPASLGAKVVNTAAINPNDGNDIYITVDTDEDLLQTTDGGSSWSTIDATLGFDATALIVLFSGRYLDNRYFGAGNNGADLDILYSPNNGASDKNVEDATVGALAAIIALEVTEA